MLYRNAALGHRASVPLTVALWDLAEKTGFPDFPLTITDQQAKEMVDIFNFYIHVLHKLNDEEKGKVTHLFKSKSVPFVSGVLYHDVFYEYPTGFMTLY